MLRKLFNLVRYAVDLETLDNAKGRQLRIRVTTHYGGLETDVYIARWRGVQVYSEHLSFYAGRLMLKHGVAETREWNGGRDYSETVVIGPLQWSGWDHQGTYAETFSIFGKQVGQRVS